MPKGWEDEDVLDDESAEVDIVTAEVVARPRVSSLKSVEGQESASLSSDTYRVYRVRQEWVAEHLRDRIADVLDSVSVERIGADILALGRLTIDGRKIAVYFVRRLDDEKARAAVDTELRSRSGQGIGLVLQAGDMAAACLAANVLTPVLDHLDPHATEIALDGNSLRETYRRNRSLARGGETVDLTWTGETGGMLSMPGAGTIHITGGNRMKVLERLVEAHNGGPAPVKAGDLTRDHGDQSLPNIFGSVLWAKLKHGFIRSPKQTLWEIDA